MTDCIVEAQVKQVIVSMKYVIGIYRAWLKEKPSDAGYRDVVSGRLAAISYQ